MKSLKAMIAIGSTAALLGACASAGVQTASLEKSTMSLDRSCANSSNASCTVDKTEQHKSNMRGDLNRLEAKAKAPVRAHTVR